MAREIHVFRTPDRFVAGTVGQPGNRTFYLQAVHDKFAKKGFTVLGFPCNQFGKQEPGTALEIKKFCTDNYSVTFPLHAKIEVNGDGAHPLYKKLKKESGGSDKIRWNFNKGLYPDFNRLRSAE